jgi:hypothetical protein
MIYFSEEEDKGRGYGRTINKRRIIDVLRGLKPNRERP